jgi:hypothetical protein
MLSAELHTTLNGEVVPSLHTLGLATHLQHGF